MDIRIYVYRKPFTDDSLYYRTFEAAERACRIGGLIEEWICTEGTERFLRTIVWERMKDGFLILFENPK